MNKVWFLGIGVLAILPSTTNYKLNSYGFGSGGGAGLSTATYSLEGLSGETNGTSSSTANDASNPGYIQTQQANVPKIASLDNNGGIYYNQLHFVIDNQNNPSDAKFLISVSTDNFVTVKNYLQPDGTLSGTLQLADYQTYAAFGASGGSMIIGLNPGTTYYVRALATQGKFSESAYGPSLSMATANPTISFSLQTSSGPTPPYTISMGTLSEGVINTSAQTINTSFSTNAASGGNVYVTGKNGGLYSSSQSHLISSVSNDLGSLSSGFGAQNSSISQVSGGPYTVVAPYAGSGNVVGTLDSTTRSLYSSSAPLSGGSGVLKLLAKAANTDVAATDYQDVLTFTASANF